MSNIVTLYEFDDNWRKVVSCDFSRTTEVAQNAIRQYTVDVLDSEYEELQGGDWIKQVNKILDNK